MRSEGREFAFQYLYHLQVEGFEDRRNDLAQTPSDIDSDVFMFRNAISISPNEQTTEFATSLVRGVILHYDELTGIVESKLQNWKLSRLSKTDLTVLLMGTHELLRGEEAPVPVVINEYIELSKRYGDAESGRFINGILDSIAKQNLGA